MQEKFIYIDRYKRVKKEDQWMDDVIYIPISKVCFNDITIGSL